MMTIKEFVEERGIGSLRIKEIKDSLYSDSKQIELGKNFIKLYNLMCNYVDLEEYSETYDDLVVLNAEINRDLYIGKSAMERQFVNYVNTHRKIFKLVMEVCDNVKDINLLEKANEMMLKKVEGKDGTS